MAHIPSTQPASSARNPNATTSTSTNAAAAAASAYTDANADTPQEPTKKRKRKDKAQKEAHILHQTTFRTLPWTYLHLRLTTPSSLDPSSSSSPPPPSASSTTTKTIKATAHDLSPLLTSTLLTAPLRAYLGVTGAAIPVDILRTRGRDVWVRIPRGDARGVRAAVSGWVGSCEGEDVGVGGGGGGRVQVAWRVVGEGMGVLCGGGGGDGAGLFAG